MILHLFLDFKYKAIHNGTTSGIFALNGPKSPDIKDNNSSFIVGIISIKFVYFIRKSISYKLYFVKLFIFLLYS